MSKLFFDKYILFEEIEIELKKLDLSTEEKQEFEHLIEEEINHRALDRVLTHLPHPHHEEFLDKFHKNPHDEALLTYINEKIESTIEEHLHDEMQKLKREILQDLQESKKK